MLKMSIWVILSHLLTALTLSHLRPWLKFSLLFTKKFLCYQFGEFGIGSANNPLSDIVILMTCQLDIVLIYVRRNAVLVTYGS